MKFRVIIEQDEDGMFAVHCPNLAWLPQPGQNEG